jgi:hypothetical protein
MSRHPSGGTNAGWPSSWAVRTLLKVAPSAKVASPEKEGEAFTANFSGDECGEGLVSVLHICYTRNTARITLLACHFYQVRNSNT